MERVTMDCTPDGGGLEQDTGPPVQSVHVGGHVDLVPMAIGVWVNGLLIDTNRLYRDPISPAVGIDIGTRGSGRAGHREPHPGKICRPRGDGARLVVARHGPLLAPHGNTGYLVVICSPTN